MGAPIDIAAARATFDESTDFTVGLEEEFAILDPVTLDLVPRFEELRDAAAQEDPVLHAQITGELISSEIEIVSGRGEDIHDAIARQRDIRRRLFLLARSRDLALGATATHPWADYREQRNIDTEHYRRVVDGLGYVARRNNTFSLHVHVGVNGADRAVRTADRLRPVLPVLLAYSANSPFVDGRDAGLHSARTQTFTRMFPRCGVPDAYGSWAAYQEYIDLLVRTRSVVEYTQVWWSVRPHFTYGTVEVRICDAQSTAAESEALASLVVSCVAQAARDVEEGVPFTDPAARFIEENTWRAVRHGMEGPLLDLEAGIEIPAAAAVDALAEWTTPVRAELGIDPPRTERPNGAQRQIAARGAGADLREVYASTVQETAETYGMAAEVRR
ncbi:MAG: glutamate---cysteine ligase / carboxylate-amine ligase [Solirubrobacteraceae bacterium]|jgi:carboxylate-amine ligase|nr:glutamate---cysteine ligase / carboxylate-amine ligase [Solirubrobacteraceae bacterium]